MVFARCWSARGPSRCRQGNALDKRDAHRALPRRRARVGMRARANCQGSCEAPLFSAPQAVLLGGEVSVGAARANMTHDLGNSPSNPGVMSQRPASASHATSHPFLPFVDGVYRTPKRRISRLARMFPSAAFYVRFASIVWLGGWRAKRGRYGGREWSQSSVDVLHALEAVGCQFDITGVEHLQRLDGPCVVAGNHMSTLETAVLPVIIEPIREVTFVIKRSLVDYPVFKHIMRSRHPIAVSQTNPREDLRATLVEGAERLGRGVSVVVFPEGSRRAEFDPLRFNTIGVKLAGRAGVPIIPVALLTDAWALGHRIADLGRIDPARKIRFAFGPPISVEGRGAEAQQSVIEFIVNKLAAWKTEDRDGSQAGLGDATLT
jgi:1-acyl-sn-glycerol-3-phosphate acyltransferase